MAQGIRPCRPSMTLGHNVRSVCARLLAGAVAVAALGFGGTAIERTADAVAIDAVRPDAVVHATAEVEKDRTTDDADGSIIHFGGRAYKAVGTMRMRVTAYSPDARSCGKFADGITASGKRVTHNGGFLVAADTRLLPFGTMVSVPGYFNGWPVPVLDRGGAIKGKRLDVLFPTHARARRWGVQHLDVVVWREVTEP